MDGSSKGWKRGVSDSRAGAEHDVHAHILVAVDNMITVLYIA